MTVPRDFRTRLLNIGNNSNSHNTEILQISHCLSNKNNQIQRPEADTIGVLRNFAKFTGTIAQVFLVNFVKFLKAPFLQNTSGRLLLNVVVLGHFKLFVIQPRLKKIVFF